MSRVAQCQNKMVFASPADAKRYARQERQRSGVARMSSMSPREARARGYGS